MRERGIFSQPDFSAGDGLDSIESLCSQRGVVCVGVFYAQSFAIHSEPAFGEGVEKAGDQDVSLPVFEIGGVDRPEGKASDLEILRGSSDRGGLFQGMAKALHPHRLTLFPEKKAKKTKKSPGRGWCI